MLFNSGDVHNQWKPELELLFDWVAKSLTGYLVETTANWWMANSVLVEWLSRLNLLDRDEISSVVPATKTASLDLKFWKKPNRRVIRLTLPARASGAAASPAHNVRGVLGLVMFYIFHIVKPAKNRKPDISHMDMPGIAHKKFLFFLNGRYQKILRRNNTPDVVYIPRSYIALWSMTMYRAGKNGPVRMKMLAKAISWRLICVVKFAAK